MSCCAEAAAAVQHLHEEWRRTVGMNGLGSPLTSWPVRRAPQTFAQVKQSCDQS
jgi:hypothetical protein